jgi:hypothetical protein
MFIACRMKLAVTPFADEFSMPMPPTPDNPHHVYRQCLP